MKLGIFKHLFVIWVLYIVIFASLCYAQPEPAPILSSSISPDLEKKIALDLRDMNVVDVLKFLAQKGNINIVATKEVKGKVSLFLKEVSIKDALEIILLANNLAYERKENIIFVMTEEEYMALHGTKFKDRREVRTVKLRYARPDYAFEILKVLKSDIGKLAIDDESGLIIMLDTPEYLKKMLEAIKKIDQPSITKVFSLQYAKAEVVKSALIGRLDAKKVGSITADERSNQVIVRALPERMKEIEHLIKKLDTKTKEVLLEVKIIKVILSDDFNMGISWDSDLTLRGDVKMDLTKGSRGFFEIGTLTADEYVTTLKALRTYGRSKNLSSPSIAVVNNQEAKIHIGTTEAYVTTTTTTGQTTSTTAEEVTFIDVGVQLTVTPIINDEEFITLKIKPEVSSVASTYTTPSANKIPIVDTTEVETTVMIRDGATVVIGGLKKDEKIETVKKVPLLGSLPLLGMFFRKTVRDTENTELFVFITPHIISGADDVVDGRKKPKPIREYEN